MSKLDEKREEIAALVARDLGLGDLAALSAADRETVEAETATLILRNGQAIADASDPVAAHVRLAKLLAEYRTLANLTADERDAKLADEGEVFAREDDA
ncbi:hypothetical protein [Methylobacterium organophilum]|uniref:Terminase small subunit n=1 Tax=Methylobacterium organophilum TaxID=410 RepID=A0ABQ4TCM7_METOR|nr:hypothetical protein [Methylobacterium organophilum]UMY18594.1 hypothetical protein MMB17_04485 [Methylobacterium organophilum]GJE29461.1 hypothetical protein LKMONMHP_4342 [Methylobacterium organophilum]